MTFTMTRNQLETLRAKAAAQGVVIAGDSGRFTQHAVTIDYAYANDALKLETVEKPWYVSQAMIDGEMGKLIQGAM